MIASKGDHAFGLRTENNMLYFFIHAGGEWRSVSYARSTDAASGWIGQMHQLAGIYDAENDMIRIYCDGKMVAEKSTGTSAGVTESSYNLTLGSCPETNRSSEADFYDLRVYSKALTASELASQNTSDPAYPADSKYVQLWLDMDNAAKNAVVGDIDLDGEATVSDLVLLQNYLLRRKTFTYEQFSAADINLDSYVDAFDLVELRKILSNI